MPKIPTDTALALGGPTMGTRWSVLIDDPVPAARIPALQTRFQAVLSEVDRQMSTWSPDSDLMRLNAAPLQTWVPLPSPLLTVLAAGLAISHQTGGAFEMNVGDAVRAWGFGADKVSLTAIRAASAARRVPATTALDLNLPAGLARKSADLALDLSGIAKGYGVDCLAETAAAMGLTSALCAVDGEVRAIGARQDVQPWAISIDNPDGPPQGSQSGPQSGPQSRTQSRRQSGLALQDMAAATSGDYRHFVTVGTARLSHTMDPRRGAPLVAAPASVTVLAHSCMMADAMATALTVMGAAKGASFARQHAISALFLLRQPGDFGTVGTGLFAG